MSKEFRIGLITIISGALLYYGFNFLRGSDLFSPTKRYYVIYPNISGLIVSNPVNFMGMSVGRVSIIDLQQDKGRIVVGLDIDDDLKISDDAVATLTNADLFGSKAIKLDVGGSGNLMQAGDTLESVIEDAMMSQIEDVSESLSSTISHLNEVLEQLSQTDLKGTVEELQNTLEASTRAIDDLRPQLGGTLETYNKMGESIDEQVNALSPIMGQTKQLMDSLNSVEINKTVDNLNQLLDNVNEALLAVQSNEGSLGKLMSSDSLYNNLNTLILDLDTLANHFNEYPKDFLKPLGRKNNKLKGL